MSIYTKPDDVIDYEVFVPVGYGDDRARPSLIVLCDRAKADPRWDWKHNNGNVTLVGPLADDTMVWEMRLVPCPEKVNP